MTPSDKDKLVDWYESLERQITLDILLTQDKRSEEFVKFAVFLSDLGEKITINEKKEENPELMPAIIISPNLKYHAIPLERELDPFLAALDGSDMENQKKNIKFPELSRPVPSVLYIATQCPFCPNEVARLTPFTTSGYFDLSITDGQLFSEKAEADEIKAVPTFILDKKFRWTGKLPFDEIAKVMANRDISMMGGSAMEQIIQDGKAGRLAHMMVERKKIFPDFPKLFVSKTWSIRLGAIVTLENIVGKDKKIARDIVPLLWEYFDDADDTAKGDILYAIGVAGNKDEVENLEKIAQGNFSEDVKDAAKEAIEAIAES